jgi:hypothetical protein
MAILRADVERALDEIISQEEGMRFQGLAVVLGKKLWPELIARQRKKDLGLDAYAPASLTGNVGKGLAASITPKLSKVLDDARTGKENFTDLQMLLFVTPAKVGNADRRAWEAKIKEQCGLELHLIEREEIITQMLLPENAALCGSFLNIAVDMEPEVGDLLDKAKRAAATVTSAWAARTKGYPLIELSTVRLKRNGEPSEERLALEQIDQALLQSRRIVIEGPAGRGKTTTLVQLALRERATGIALLIELPAWISSRQGILDFIAGMPAFQAEGLTAAHLAQVQQSETLLLLLNGWNEIAQSNSLEASTALAALERDFPSSGIAVASRTHHIVPPLPGAMRLRLQRILRAQRVVYLAARLGDKAAELRARIDADQSLDELTRTPFVLSEVVSLFESGASIPSTKIGILVEVLRLHEQQIEHANALQLTPVFGQQTAYLKAIGTEMTRRGAVTMSEADARGLVATVARGLVESGQIETVGAAAVLATLTAHHVLERIDYPEPAFRFEHQQVQEFYAALDLRAHILSLEAENEVSGRRFIADYLNNATWAEPLRMIAATFAERIGDIEIEKRNTRAGVRLVRMTLTVDPLFAAELSHYCGVLVWGDVGDALQERLRAIHAMGERSFRDYAIAAMLATGVEVFGDILMTLLSSPSQQVRLGTYRLWPEFSVSSLGANWREVVRGWTEEAREDFVSELLHHRVDADIAAFAAEDENSTVKKAAADGLVWNGSDAELVRVVDSMDAKTFDELAQKELEYLPTSIRPRAVQAVRRQAKSAPGAVARLRAASRLIELGEPGLDNVLIEAILALSNKDVKDVGLHFLRPALEQALQIDAVQTSGLVAARVADGAIHAAEDWSSFVSAIPERLVMDYVCRLATENLSGRNIEGLVGIVAAGANAKLAAHVFARLRELRLQINAQPRQRHDHEVQLQRQLEALFRRLPGDIAAAGILDAVTASDLMDILVTTDVLSRAARPDVERLSVSDRVLKARLRAFVKSGIEIVLHEDDFNGEQKANLASSIAQVGEPEDMVDLARIIRVDIERIRRGRAARVAGDRGPVANGAIMSHSRWNIMAVMDLDPSSAAELLVELLAESEYVSDVASAMARDYVNAPATHWDSILNYERMWAARENNHLRPAADARREQFTAALKAEAARLIEKSSEGKPAAVGLLELARALAIVGGHGAAATALDILALKGHRDEYCRLEAAEHTLMAGVTLPAETAFELIDSLFARTRDWLSDSDRHLLSRILVLLPFVDHPEAGIARMRDVLHSGRLRGSNWRGPVVALGHSRSDASIDLLAELASDASMFEQCQDCLVNALATLDTSRSRELLLGFVDPAVPSCTSTRKWHREEVLVERLTDVARRRPDAAMHLLELCRSDVPEFSRQVLSSVMARLGTPEALAANLDLIDDAKQSAVPRGLWDQLRNTFLAREAYENDPNTFIVRGQASNETRARLFKMATGGDPKHQRSALEILGQIELWRLEDGKPVDEPRHPDLASDGLWPPT